MPNAWVTLATTDGYAIGALVLAQSLKNVKTQHNVHILYTKTISNELIQQLKKTFDGATEVNVLDSKDYKNLFLINRPDLGVTFTKIFCWRLTQYSKCVFLDADTLVLQNSDELFEHPEIAAAPDTGWPDYFNSGVFVFIPSQKTYEKLLELAYSHGSFDGGDQGLLNKFFNNWRKQGVNHRLSFLYNVTCNTVYSYAAAIKRHLSQIKIVHFLGKDKPWNNKKNEFDSIFLQKWNKIFLQVVSNCNFSISFIKKLQILQNNEINNIQLKNNLLETNVLPNQNLDKNLCFLSDTNKRYEAWEQGNPDYKGNDSFSNIQKVIEKSLQ